MDGICSDRLILQKIEAELCYVGSIVLVENRGSRLKSDCFVIMQELVARSLFNI